VREGANISAGTFGNGNGGDLTVNASESVEVIGVDVNGSSSGLFVDTKGEGDAGNLILDTKQLLVQDGAQINASTLGEGKGGSLNITALESTTLVGRSPDDVFPSGLLAITEGEKDAGNLIITTKQFDIQDGAVVSAATFGSGQGGIISINAPQLITLGVDSKLTVETTGAGKPGDINISTDTLTIGEDAQLSATATATSTNTEGGGSITLNANNLSISGKLGIFAETKSIAPAGNLILQPLDGRGDLAPTLNIQFTDNGFISASTSADGQGGNITISAPQTLDIRGDGKITVETSGRGNAGTINLSSQILTLADGLEISASTTGEGGAGNINLTAKTIDLSNGAQIRTNTAGSNNAGDINLQIAENLKLTGENTGIFADTAIDSLGNGGNIAIDLSLLQIEDGATVSVNSQGKGIGGNISISSGDLNLNRGTIFGQSASNQGGNITLKIDNLLTLNNHSQISTTAGTEKAGGDGGNITINSNFIIANPLQNSDITANAFTGRGGNINITTQGILGLQVRKETTNLSDITASSEFGLDGTININDPGVDPTTGLENLPQTSIEATISQGCQVRKGKAAVEFYQLGKGGFPISPNDWLTADPFSYEGLIPLETLASSFQKIDRVSFVPNGFALSCQK
jgi:large exoprotein involved in heme utilization and adhesion